MSDKSFSINSLCVREHKDNKSTSPHQLPIYATSSFTFETIEDCIDTFTGQKSGYSYSRYGNPTMDTVASKIAALECFDVPHDGYAYLTSSGMSAISTIIYALTKAGDKILTQSNLYGGTTEFLAKVAKRHGITTLFQNFSDFDSIVQTLNQNSEIRLIYLETPANPTLALVDLAKVAEICRQKNIISIIDNTFCTPYLQRPITLGIDFVIHSTTKYLNGHGNSIAGIIVGHQLEYQKEIFSTLKLMGGTCNAWDAWLLNNGLKTLALRMEKHCENALKLAYYLEKHPNVEYVNYNGLPSSNYHELAKRQMKNFGGMLSFAVRGDLKATLEVINRFNLCTQAPTLGDVDTLILHPATSSHLNIEKSVREANGIPDNLIRVSVGIEDIQDLIEDFKQAL